MDFTGPIVQLLSEPPGSFIYHLVTLFALQVVFALSFARWRREPEDNIAWHMMIGSGAIFAGRLILVVVGLIYSNDPAAAAAALPPLEQAVNTASVALFVWAILPPSRPHGRSGDILLVATLILTGVAYVFFAQAWQAQATAEVAYQSTQQAVIWALAQISILAISFVYLLLRGRQLGPYPPLIVGILLAAHLIQLWSYPELPSSDSNISFWIRLSYLVALPLWAVYAYLHATTPLLESEARLQASIEKLGLTLEQAAQVVASNQPQRRMVYALELLRRAFGAEFAAIGLVNEDEPTQIAFYGSRRDQQPGQVVQWQMDLEQQLALNTVFSQGRPTELNRDGLGSRQLYDFFEAAGIEPAASLLVQPLSTNGKRLGLLCVPLRQDSDHWGEEARKLAPGLAHFLAQALLPTVAPPPVPSPPETVEPEPSSPTTAVPAAIVFDRVRVQDLEYQLKQTREALDEAEQKRRQAEANALAAQKQARYLAAALRTVQSSSETAGQAASPSGGDMAKSDAGSEPDV
jgi:PAS domain-containing protein